MTTPCFWIQEPKECVTRLESRYHHGNRQCPGSVTSRRNEVCAGGSREVREGGAPPLGGSLVPQGFVPLFWAGPAEVRGSPPSGVPRNRCLIAAGEVGGSELTRWRQPSQTLNSLCYKAELLLPVLLYVSLW